MNRFGVIAGAVLSFALLGPTGHAAERHDHKQWRDRQERRSRDQQRAQEREQREAWQRYRARSWETEHRTWQQRGGYSGPRIADSYFRAYYGRNHYFRVYRQPFRIVDGSPRFQFNGYWFSSVDPYPEYWGPNWYQNDDVYVDYVNDGYYLFNRRYPQRPGIALHISF